VLFRSPLLDVRGDGAHGWICEVTGHAADFEIPTIANQDLAHWIKENLVFDQLILEFHHANDPKSGWVHCSYRQNHNRQSCLIFNGTGNTNSGLIENQGGTLQFNGDLTNNTSGTLTARGSLRLIGGLTNDGNLAFSTGITDVFGNITNSATGQVSVAQAVVWMVVQALIAAAILATFNRAAIALGVLSLFLVAIYPFAKRFTWWPQAFLGLAFNWGALLAWTAHTGALHWPAVILYGAGIAWTLFYDTIYAHQDTEDDAMIGVKSTARLFGDESVRWLKYFLVITTALMGLAIIRAVLPNGSILALVIALAGPWAMGWHMAWQLRGFDQSDSAKMHQLFLANRDTGFIPLIFFCAALLA